MRHAPKIGVGVGVSSQSHEPRREHLVDLVPVEGSIPQVKQITGFDVATGQVQGERNPLLPQKREAVLIEVGVAVVESENELTV